MNKILIALVLLVTALPAAAKDVYQEPAAFIAEAFEGDPPKPELLWVLPPMQEDIRKIMDRRLNQLRIRYWGRDGRTAWILEEIGKEHPITTGFVVEDGKLQRVRVLIYRESRGYEVRYPFFTKQFDNARLTPELRLSRPIDGITGATLSVQALKRMARLALYLHSQTDQAHGDAQ